MSRAAILSFSEKGGETAARIAAVLSADYETARHVPKGNLKALTAALFPAVEALVFVGACGIAVRAIAPHLVSKTSDPAVLVADEKGEFVISLLSGHIGGANELARRVAEAIGATPVITTATDVNRRFAADAWAARQGLAIGNMEAAKRFSAEILKRDLPLLCDFPIEGSLPPGVVAGETGDCGLAIACRDARPFAATLLLIPRLVLLHVDRGHR
ncbi:MAG: cobalamin biosynthesis protein CbiG, partial [Clostridia bacterium]|nr:cobalamin biosynthesis protein CbiG [Clostridia bacterium]